MNEAVERLEGCCDKFEKEIAGESLIIGATDGVLLLDTPEGSGSGRYIEYCPWCGERIRYRW